MSKKVVLRVLFLVITGFWNYESVIAQSNPLADTIWDGNAEIIVPKLIWKQERP
jgi:hypothetical protein